MLGDKRILAVVPARGGSKGMPLKNLRQVLGVPLVARAGHVVAQVAMIDRAVVSTDHEEIARVAEAAGLAAPFRCHFIALCGHPHVFKKEPAQLVQDLSSVADLVNALGSTPV